MIKSKKSQDFGEFLMAQNRGQRDLERKSSADERELYNGTASEETKIEQKNSIKMEKTADFQP